MIKVKLTLVKSPIGHPHDQKATLKALGMGKMHSSRVHVMNPSVLGQIKKVSHLVRVEEVTE